MSFAVLADACLSGFTPEIDAAMVRARARARHYGEALVLSTVRGDQPRLVVHVDRLGGPCQLLLRFPLRLVAVEVLVPAVALAETAPDWMRAGATQLPLFAESP